MPKINHIATDGARVELNRLARFVLVVAIVAAGLPLMATPVSAALDDQEQRDYRWYDNTYIASFPTPDTPLAAENTAIANVASGDVIHVEINVHAGFNDDVPAGTAYKLQHATSTGGPWTDVGGIGSGAIWRGFDNSGLADGIGLNSTVLAASTEKVNYEEENPGTLLSSIGKEKDAEWGWVVQNNGAADNTTYYFRIALDSGSALNSYVNYPQLTTNPVASVTVTETGGSTDVTEGGTTDTYDVVLDLEPSGTVSITISSDADATTTPASLTFTTGNWSTPQTVTVTAVNDAILEGTHTGTITHSASGGSYDGASISNVVANVTDNDTASVTVTETGGSTDVTEGGATDTYDVVLDLEPSGTVTVTLNPDADASLSASSLTFTTGNWFTPQTITVTAVDDAIVEGAHTGTITHSASGGSYDGVSISNVVANITDNDNPSVTITETATSTNVVEGGATDTYDVVLDLEPSGTVTITITSDADATTTPGSLTFTTGNWFTAQTATVTAIDDTTVEGAHTGTITHSASGGSYDGVSISNVVANITDNDDTVTVTESGGSTDVTEGSTTDTYDVVLDNAPTGTVTITMSSDADVTTTPATLTFTTGNWSTAQTVTVTAINDTTVEGAHTGTITHSASGGSYDGASISNVVANVTDNDIDGTQILEQLEYRWFTNADSASPGAALAAQDTPFTDAVEDTPYHLRMSIEDTFVDLNPGEVFKLQYSTSLSGPWTDLGGLTATTTWRGFDNSSPADGATLSSNLLTLATVLQTYEETNDSAATPAKIDVTTAAEWAWVVYPNAMLPTATYYFRMVRQNGAVLDTYTQYPEIELGNATPDAPVSLGPAQFVDNNTGWTNDNTPTLTFTLPDVDTEQQVKYQIQVSATSTFASLDVDYTSDLQAQGAGSFTVGQAGGTYAVGSQGMTLADNGTGYFWRVSTEDELSATSTSTIAGSATTSDFRIDTTAPTGTVNDGTGADIDFNNGSLTTMSANWTGFTDALSGIDFHEYSVGTTPGATDMYAWTNVFMGVNVTNSMLVLHTGQTYYFNVRVTDVAGNTSTFVASDGQGVLPTLAVTVSSTDIQLGNFGPENNNTASTTMMTSISTNAYQGYTLLVYAADYLRSLDNPAVIIPDFSAGTYDSPAEWSGTGWGFNTDDCDLNGGAFWTGAGCTGNRKYAPITQTAPGNVVGDHSTLVDGSTGPVSDVITLTLRATTSTVQEHADYSTSFIVVVKPVY